MDILTKSPSQFQSLNLSSKFSTSTILEIEWTNKNSITQSVQDVSKMCKCITLIAQLSRNKRTFNIVYYIGRYREWIYTFRSDTVHLECQVRACLDHSCQPACAKDTRRYPSKYTYNEYDEFLLNETLREYEDEIDERLVEEEIDEIIYEDEPEAELVEELADMSNVRAAMLKSANRFKQFDDDTDGMDYQLSRFVVLFSFTFARNLIIFSWVDQSENVTSFFITSECYFLCLHHILRCATKFHFGTKCFVSPLHLK